jgi:hypothetical protein
VGLSAFAALLIESPRTYRGRIAGRRYLFTGNIPQLFHVDLECHECAPIFYGESSRTHQELFPTQHLAQLEENDA